MNSPRASLVARRQGMPCTFCRGCPQPCRRAPSKIKYQLNVVPSLGASLDVKRTSDLFCKLCSRYRVYLSLALSVGPGANQKEDHLLVGVFSDLLDPVFQLLETVSGIDGEYKKDSCDSLVERPN